jgi:hypothetical protein
MRKEVGLLLLLAAMLQYLTIEMTVNYSQLHIINSKFNTCILLVKHKHTIIFDLIDHRTKTKLATIVNRKDKLMYVICGNINYTNVI